jgi:hypothetical protein
MSEEKKIVIIEGEPYEVLSPDPHEVDGFQCRLRRLDHRR